MYTHRVHMLASLAGGRSSQEPWDWIHSQAVAERSGMVVPRGGRGEMHVANLHRQTEKRNAELPRDRVCSWFCLSGE